MSATNAPADAAAAPSNVDIMGPEVANLYAVYGKLSAASANPALMAAESGSYEAILASVKGTDAAKQLAGDYIPQFLHHFPALVETGINAQLDLIEDEKSIIRIHAIRGLELITKNNPSTVGRIADVLAQLLIVPEPLELSCVKTTFAALLGIDAKAAFLALFTQCATTTDAALRKTVFEFLQAQLKAQSASLKKDAEASAALCAGLKAVLSSQSALPLGRDELRFFVQTLIALCPHGNAPAKIRADETLKAELNVIALTQTGLAASGGVLDLTNEAKLRHFLAVQGVVNNLVREYGVDGAPFGQVFFTQILPNLEAIADADLRTLALHSVASAAPALTPKQAQTFFTTFFTIFKAVVPTGEIVVKSEPAAAAAAAAPAAAEAAAPVAAAAPAGPLINFASAEVLVYLFHLLAPLAPGELKQSTGIFTPTGQPGESLTAPNEKRDEFLNRVAFLIQSTNSYKATLNATSKTISEQLKAALQKIARLEAIALGKSPKDRAAALAAATGQPVGPEKPKVEPVVPEPTIEEERATLASLRTKQNAVHAAIRLAASVVALAKPLLVKPLPTFLTAQQMNLSYRSRRAAPDAKAGGKPPQQQQQPGKGQKRKSAGPDQQTKSASNKKRSAQGQQQQATQQKSKKQKVAANANQQQQQQKAANSNKKQKQQQQQQQAASNKGGRRRR